MAKKNKKPFSAVLILVIVLIALVLVNWGVFLVKGQSGSEIGSEYLDLLRQPPPPVDSNVLRDIKNQIDSELNPLTKRLIQRPLENIIRSTVTSLLYNYFYPSYNPTLEKGLRSARSAFWALDIASQNLDFLIKKIASGDIELRSTNEERLLKEFIRDQLEKAQQYLYEYEEMAVSRSICNLLSKELAEANAAAIKISELIAKIDGQIRQRYPQGIIAFDPASFKQKVYYKTDEGGPTTYYDSVDGLVCDKGGACHSDTFYLVEEKHGITPPLKERLSSALYVVGHEFRYYQIIEQKKL